KGAILCGTIGSFPGMSVSQLNEAVETMRPLAYSAETSDQISAAFVTWQTSNQVEIDRFLRDPLNGKPFCNRMMYRVLLVILELWKPETEQRILKDHPILITCGTRDPVGGMTASVRPLIERYRQYGVKELSHIFYEGARHEPLNDFCREQMYADVVGWLDGH